MTCCFRECKLTMLAECLSFGRSNWNGFCRNFLTKQSKLVNEFEPTQCKMDRNELKDKLLHVTLENTELMKELSALKMYRMTLGMKLNDSTFSEPEKSMSNHAGIAQQKSKLLEQCSRQEKEITQLQLEIQSLNAKCGSNQFGIPFKK